MAPIATYEHDGIEQKLKDIIQDLYNIMVQTATYDTMGGARPSSAILASEVKAFSQSLQALHAAASASASLAPGGGASPLPSVPPELITYVENGRNPDIYTREFVELVRRGNQMLAGKMGAFGAFRDVLAGEMERALPEVREDVRRVVAATGGRGDGGTVVNGGGAGEERSANGVA